MLESNDVIFGFRMMLGRDPESQATIDAHRNFATLHDLGLALGRSEEFRNRFKEQVPLWPTQKWVCARVRHGLRLWVDLHDSCVSWGCLQDNYQPAETRLAMSYLRPGDRFVDIGASIGWFTVLACHRVGPAGRVWAFEPRPDIFAMLRQSVQDNGFQDRCTLYDCAVGDHSGIMGLTRHESSTNPGGTHHVADDQCRPGHLRREVSVQALDDLSIEGPVRLLKIDVEGAEPLVLRGGRALITRDRPVVITEISAEGMPRVSGITPAAYFLEWRMLGYRVFRLTDADVGSEISEADMDLEINADPFNLVCLPEWALTEGLAGHRTMALPRMTSYAQNFEDVMLRRALKDINKGFYVDVGAWHPSRDSVTLHFYKEGWRGINVEPNLEMYNKLTMQRLEDINLHAVVASSGGSRRLFVIGETGLATIDPEIVALDRTQGFDVTDEYDVPAVTLQDLLEGHAAGHTVDFLKIDVEGAEGEILLATSFETARPRILVIEAVLPNTQEPTWEAWEPHLLAHGYTFVWFDGLNRFYLREEDRDRAEHFALPPNVFDNFVTARTDPTPALEDELRASLGQVAALRAENASIRSELSFLKHSPSWRLTRPVRWISSLMCGSGFKPLRRHQPPLLPPARIGGRMS